MHFVQTECRTQCAQIVCHATLAHEWSDTQSVQAKCNTQFAQIACHTTPAQGRYDMQFVQAECDTQFAQIACHTIPAQEWSDMQFVQAKEPQRNKAFAMQAMRFSKKCSCHEALRACISMHPKACKATEFWQYGRRSCFVTFLVLIPKFAIRVRRDEANGRNDSFSARCRDMHPSPIGLGCMSRNRAGRAVIVTIVFVSSHSYG